MDSILIIDDEPNMREILTQFLSGLGYLPMVAETLSDGIDMATSGNFDLVFLDVNLPDGNGLEALDLIRKVISEPEVIIITGDGNAKGAKMAIDSGAWDYILKPFSDHEIKLQVERSLDYRASKKISKASNENFLDRSGIIGSSPKLMSKLNMVSQYAQTDTNILITGETGTGKELFAKVIHKNSRQKENNFIVVDCASLPEQLVESVLFGHVKGSFTGADSHQDGMIKKADGGTLFLDEIGELPLSIQQKFLRVLQERKYKPVGSTAEMTSKFRLVSATNKNLEEMVADNQFRSDLLFRLRTIHIDLPPLRECKDDIKDLTLHYIYILCEHYGLENKGFVHEFLKNLEYYDWPGNTRELISCLEKAILDDPKSPLLYPNYLPNQVRIQYIQSFIDKNPEISQEKGPVQIKNHKNLIEIPEYLLDPVQSLKQVKDFTAGETEQIYLKRLLHVSQNDINEASKLSRMSKGHLYSLLKKYNMSTKD